VAVTHWARRRLTEAHASPRHLAEVLYRIRGLRMIGYVMHVGAHPDDDDAGLMAFVARKYGGRMVYWSATRGEAGQNRIGSHSGDARHLSHVGEHRGTCDRWWGVLVRSGPLDDQSFCAWRIAKLVSIPWISRCCQVSSRSAQLT
jgi:hypothetical protein